MTHRSKGRRIAQIGGVTLLGSLPNVLLQIGAIVSLSTAEYGVFSMVYLSFAWLSSLSLSVVAEPWLRARQQSGEGSSWNAFSSNSLWLGLFGGAVAFVAGLLVHSALLGVVSAMAVALAVYRLNARYFGITSGRTGLNIAADAASSVVLAFYVMMPGSDVVMTMSAWAISNAIPCLLTPPPLPHRLGSPVRWVKEHRRHIGTLVTDSSLMDLSTIGVPLLLAPVMGPAAFGVYRAVGSVALPVRLVLNSVRPLVGKLSPATAASWKTLSALIIGGTLIALVVCMAIALLQGVERIQGSALGALQDYLIPVGIFIAANFVAMFQQFIIRMNLGRREIISVRVVQFLISVAGPIVGWLVGGLDLAIWGTAFALLLQAIVLIGFVRRSTCKLTTTTEYVDG